MQTLKQIDWINIYRPAQALVFAQSVAGVAGNGELAMEYRAALGLQDQRGTKASRFAGHWRGQGADYAPVVVAGGECGANCA